TALGGVMRRRGITLTELLACLALVAFGLVAVTTSARFRYGGCSFHNKALTQLGLLEDAAVKTYSIDRRSLPPNLEGLLRRPAELPDSVRWDGPYLDKNEVPSDPWNNTFHYELIDQAAGKFRIWSAGPNGQDERGRGDD